MPVCTGAFDEHVHAADKHPVAGNAETLPRPQSGDAWVLRNIVHDWNDADSQRLLCAIRAAAGATPGITLCFVEVREPKFLTVGLSVLTSLV